MAWMSADEIVAALADVPEDELRALAEALGIEWDSLSGDDAREKLRRLIAQCEAAGQLDELIYRACERWPDRIGLPWATAAEPPAFDLDPGVNKGATAPAPPAPPDPGLDPTPPAPLATTETLRIDAAIPAQVTLNRAFDLAVAVRQLASPVLAVDDLNRVQSSQAKVRFAPNLDHISLRIRVTAADCAVVPEDTGVFTLERGGEAGPFYFQLTPRAEGKTTIIITLLQEDNWLCAARLSTTVVATEVGRVEVNVQPMPMSSAPGISLVALRDHMEDSFNLSELADLVFELNDVVRQKFPQERLDLENLPGETRNDKVRELIDYCDRFGLLAELRDTCRKKRPDVGW